MKKSRQDELNDDAEQRSCTPVLRYTHARRYSQHGMISPSRGRDELGGDAEEGRYLSVQEVRGRQQQRRFQKDDRMNRVYNAKASILTWSPKRGYMADASGTESDYDRSLSPVLSSQKVHCMSSFILVQRHCKMQKVVFLFGRPTVDTSPEHMERTHSVSQSHTELKEGVTSGVPFIILMLSCRKV